MLFRTMLACLLALGLTTAARAEADDYLSRSQPVVEAALGEARTRFRALVAEPEADFVREWSAIFDRALDDMERLAGEENPAGAVRQRQEAPLVYGRSWGLTVYASYHRQVPGGDPHYRPSEGYFDYIDTLDLAADELLDVEDYTDFLVVHARHAGILRAESDPAFSRGDHVTLRAQLAVAETYGTPATRCFVKTALIVSALDTYGADGLEDIAARIGAECPDRLDAIEAELAGEAGLRPPARPVVYRTVDGADLSLYVLEPDQPDPQPTLLWFHGGGMSQGAWYWCMVCEAFRDAGWRVISAEYRLFLRHGSGPADGMADAEAAYAYVVEHAGELGVDPDRIVTAGFSIGTNLALTAAGDAAVQPAAVLSYSGCVSWRDDPFARTRVRDPAELVPLAAIARLEASGPPVLFFHGDADGSCDPQLARDYVDRATAFGTAAEYVGFPDAEHFFLLADATARQTAIARSFEFLHGFGLAADAEPAVHPH